MVSIGELLICLQLAGSHPGIVDHALTMIFL